GRGPADHRPGRGREPRCNRRDGRPYRPCRPRRRAIARTDRRGRRLLCPDPRRHLHGLRGQRQLRGARLVTEGSREMIEAVNGGRRPGAPMVQLCVDVRTLPEAIEVAEMGLRAGVDWLELGTPLISWVGINVLAEFARTFPDTVKFLDAKVMDASA